jgi:septal ring factor EnvC (AmiA/AmiB activator)
VSKTLSPFDASATEKLASDNFEKNKRKLPWPVEAGNVTMEYGPQHVLEGTELIYNNQGLTIETKAGASVKVIFDGEVASVLTVGENMAVIVRHGKYFSTYSGLSSAGVAKGDKVKVGQTLGRMAEKADGMGELEFMISNDKGANLNPRLWLR